MKKLSMFALSLLMLSSLVGCMSNDNKEAEKTKDNVEEKAKKTKDSAEGTIDDMMAYFKTNGHEYSDDQTLSEFDFAAKEGKSFKYNNQMMYIYRVDPSDAKMSGLIDQAQADNMVTANQNGETIKYGARVNGNYLMVYDQNADVTDLLNSFDKYKYETKE